MHQLCEVQVAGVDDVRQVEPDRPFISLPRTARPSAAAGLVRSLGWAPTDASRAFILMRCKAGAQLTLDLWYNAWLKSEKLPAHW